MDDNVASIMRRPGPGLACGSKTWLRHSSWSGRDIRLASCSRPPCGFHPCNTRSLAEPILIELGDFRLAVWGNLVDGRPHGPPVSCHQRAARAQIDCSGPIRGSADDNLEGPRAPVPPYKYSRGVSSLGPLRLYEASWNGARGRCHKCLPFPWDRPHRLSDPALVLYERMQS